MTAANEGQTVRQLACDILLKVDTQKAYADILLDRGLQTTELNDADRGLLTELIYGTLRWRGKIDAELSRFVTRPLSDVEPLVRAILRLALYQVLFLDKIPAYAAVNEAVEIAKSYRRKSAGFVNGVLRNFLRQRQGIETPVKSSAAVEVIAAEYSHPTWLVQRWYAYYGAQDAQALMLALNQRAPLVLRVNLGKISRADLIAELRRAGVGAEPTLLSPQGISLSGGARVDTLHGFAAGLFQVQGEASQLVSLLLDPQPGENILDACAAPGGKTSHIAELIGDRGRIVALDHSPRGVEKIRANIQRLGLESVETVHADASGPLPAAIAGRYDRILVDAPCSGLGTLRSHPEIKWQRGENDIKRLTELQSKILQAVAPHLRPGGSLVYSTCTLTTDENEQVVERFLRQHEQFELTDAAGYLPESARHMARGDYFHALPQRDNCDGFFAARMRKAL